MQSNAGIKVDKKIQPLKNLNSWLPFELIVGAKYYVSFETGYAIPCTLKEIFMQGEKQRLLIDCKNPSHHGTYILFQEEIGRTPEEAAKNKFGLF
jgi:hypothetical protein